MMQIKGAESSYVMTEAYSFRGPSFFETAPRSWTAGKEPRRAEAAISCFRNDRVPPRGLPNNVKLFFWSAPEVPKL